MIITNQQYFNLMHFIAINDILAYDTETTGLNPRKDKVIGFSVGNADEAFYVPIWAYDGQKLNRIGLDDFQISNLLIVLKTKKLVMQNGSFDCRFTAQNLGVDLSAALYADTMLALHTHDENRFSYSLKPYAAEIFGKQVLDAQTDLEDSIKANGGTGKGDIYKADVAIIAKYGAQDSVLTMRVWQHLKPLLAKDNLLEFFLETEVMSLYREVTIPMEAHGITLDIALMQQTLQEISTDIAAVESRVQQAIKPHLNLFERWFLDKDYSPSRSGAFAQGIAAFAELPLPRTKGGAYSLTEKSIAALPASHWKNVLLKTEYLSTEEKEKTQQLLWTKEGQQYMFNLNSRHHLKKLLFDTLKEQSISFTPTGQPQADQEFLESIAHKYLWVQDLLVYYKLMKLKGTYIERFLEQQEDGVFYPQFHQHRTLSGRYGSDMQQLPRQLEEDDEALHPLVLKYTNSIRNFFIAAPGTVLIDADYESLEPHIFAHVSGDPDIRAIFDQGLDFYSQVAIKTEKLQGFSADKRADNFLGKLNKSKRQTAKAYALGLCYGMSGYKLQFELNIPLSEADKLERGYWVGFPVLKKASDTARLECLSNGQVRVETGRVRRYPRAPQIFQKHGNAILHDLELWKKYQEAPKLYEQAKKDRKEIKNYLNNSFNVKVQGLAASVINRASIETAKQYKRLGLTAAIIAQIHDELLIQASNEHAEQAATILQQCMENTVKLSIKLKAKPQIGQVYGSIK